MAKESADIFKSLQVLADKILKDQKKINPRFDGEISNRLPAAIKNKNGPMIELYLATLKATLRDIEASLEDTRAALRTLSELETSDEDFVAANLKDVEKVTTSVSDAQSSLTKQFADGKKLQTQAENAMIAQQNTQEKALRQLAQLDKGIQDEKKELKETFRKSDQIATKAEAAFKARDGKSLADAQKAIKALNVDALKDSYDQQEGPLKQFIQEVEGSGFDKDAIDQLKSGAEDALSSHKASKVYVDQLVSQQKSALDFKIAPVDVKKAAKALQLDAKAEPKLAKVLNGPRTAMERGLDALAKELKLKTTGKQMLAVLEQADLI